MPTQCLLTPIMMNAKYIAITQMGLPSDISWEDFFDTCLVWLFRYWGWGLQGAYKLSEEEVNSPPKPASEKPEGNGSKPASLEEQATKLGKLMIEIMGAGVVPEGKPAQSKVFTNE